MPSQSQWIKDFGEDFYTEMKLRGRLAWNAENARQEGLQAKEDDDINSIVMWEGIEKNAYMDILEEIILTGEPDMAAMAQFLMDSWEDG